MGRLLDPRTQERDEEDQLLAKINQTGPVGKAQGAAVERPRLIDAKVRTEKGELSFSFEESAVNGRRHLLFPESDGSPRHLTLDAKAKSGTGAKEEIRGHQIEARGSKLFIDGKEYDFKAQQLVEPKKAERPKAPDVAELEKRFPGVRFVDEGTGAAGVTIGDDVRIERGARVALTPGLQIGGDAVIGKTASVSGASNIVGGRIDGMVQEATVVGSTVGREAIVRKSTVENASLAEDAKVLASKVTGSEIGKSATVRGATLKEMALGEGAVAQKAYAQGFGLEDGGILDGGKHQGIRDVGPRVFQDRAKRLREESGLGGYDYADLGKTIDTSIADLKLLKVEAEVDSKLDAKQIDRALGRLEEQRKAFRGAFEDLTRSNGPRSEVQARLGEISARTSEALAGAGKLKRSPPPESSSPELDSGRSKFRQYVDSLLHRSDPASYTAPPNLVGDPRFAYSHRMMNMDYNAINQAYNPAQAYAPAQFPMQSYPMQQGMQMPPGLFGPNQQIMPTGQKSPLSGFGKAALLGIGGMALLGTMGSMCFGYPGFGMGMGGMMLPMMMMGGLGMGGLGMMGMGGLGMMGMGGLGMMGMGGLGMGGMFW